MALLAKLREVQREIRHGTGRAYEVHRCRCADCREANRVRLMAWRRRRGVRPMAEVLAERAANRKHGTHAAYVGHRKRGEPTCDDCKAGEAAYQRQRRARNKTEPSGG